METRPPHKQGPLLPNFSFFFYIFVRQPWCRHRSRCDWNTRPGVIDTSPDVVEKPVQVWFRYRDTFPGAMFDLINLINPIQCDKRWITILCVFILESKSASPYSAPINTHNAPSNKYHSHTPTPWHPTHTAGLSDKLTPAGWILHSN